MRLLLLAAGVAALAADFAPAVPGNMRNSEADALVLRDGRLLLAWTEFMGDGKSDWTGARLSARISSDQGKTWGERFTLQENIGKMNVMEPDLLRLKSGKVLFLFARKNSEADCAPMVRISKDDAKTFSPPVAMTITPSPVGILRLCLARKALTSFGSAMVMQRLLLRTLPQSYRPPRRAGQSSTTTS